MPMKATGPAELRETVRWVGGGTWFAHPVENMRRASHALVADDGGDREDAAVWLVDPVDADGLDDWLADLGTVAGVVVLLDRHTRDSAAIARRHDVPVYVPEQMDDAADELPADVAIERLGDRVPDTGFHVVPILDNRFWTEVALYDPDDGTLVVPEAVGTAEFFLAGDERLGVHPMLRVLPPRGAFGWMRPDRVLVGHGRPLLEDAPVAPARALADALDGARSNAPTVYARNLRMLLSG